MDTVIYFVSEYFENRQEKNICSLYTLQLAFNVGTLQVLLTTHFEHEINNKKPVTLHCGIMSNAIRCQVHFFFGIHNMAVNLI